MNTTEEKLVHAMSGLIGIQEYLCGLGERKTLAQQILEAPVYQEFAAGKCDMARIELKTALTSTGLVNDPLSPSMKPPIDAGVRRNLGIRQLLPAFPTGNTAIELPRKSAATNYAGPQVGGSPLQRENVSKPESAYSFETSFVPVQTLAHFVPVSRQIFEDAGTLSAFIEGELAHGLQVAIEHGVLNGDGSVGQLDGLLAAATAYSQRSPQLAGEADVIRDALRQCAAADFTPTAIILNPDDWYDLDTKKASASDDTYTSGGPRLVSGPILWGLPVVESNALASGTFLCGDFQSAATLFIRQASSVEISKHDGANFSTGILTILAEERIALVPTNAAIGALITGSL